MKQFNRHAISLYATNELLNWIKVVKPEFCRWTLETINNRPSVYMIEIEDQNCHGMAMEWHCNKIIENELQNKLYISREKWPQEITYELFKSWFSFQYHEEVYDLSVEELAAYDN